MIKNHIKLEISRFRGPGRLKAEPETNLVVSRTRIINTKQNQL
jgi:hypothetical protein